jgi:hypothetical protein
MKPDPIFTAIKEARALLMAWSRMYGALDLAEYRARKKHGQRPWSLIAWRNYSAIGGREIDRAYDEFLRSKFLRVHGIDRKRIKKEYIDAKARERAAERAQRAWDRRAGIAIKRRECDQASEAARRADMRMAKMRPTTPVGAAAMLAYLKEDIKGGENNWHNVAFDTLIATLTAWGKSHHQ